MGWSVGRGCPLPTEEGVWGGGCAPSPEIFLIFFWFNVFKNFCVQAKGGGGIAQWPPPKYATAQRGRVGTQHWTGIGSAVTPVRVPDNVHAEMDVGPFFFTQPNLTQPTMLTQGPNPTHPSYTYVKCRHRYCKTHIFTCPLMK